MFAMQNNISCRQRILSIVICTCDRHTLLSEAIEAVLKQTFQSWELIIVDNSRDKRPARRTRSIYKNHRRIRYILQDADGLSNARNKGIELSRSRYVAFLDDDAVAKPDWAANIVSAFKMLGLQTPCVGGKVIPRWLARRPEWLTDGLLGYFSVVDWGNKLRHLKKGEWLAGCNIAFDRKSLISVGGFRNELGRKSAATILLSNEELAVCEKLKNSGKHIGYAPAAVVEHKIPAHRLNKKWLCSRVAWQAVSDFISAPEKTKKIALVSPYLVQAQFIAARMTSVLGKKTSKTELKAAEIYSHTLGLLMGRQKL